MTIDFIWTIVNKEDVDVDNDYHERRMENHISALLDQTYLKQGTYKWSYVQLIDEVVKISTILSSMQQSNQFNYSEEELLTLIRLYAKILLEMGSCQIVIIEYE